MPLIDPPPIVQQLANQLLLCPVVIAAGITIADIYYPKASPTGDDADLMPFMVIAETDQNRVKYAEGVPPLVNGVLGVTIYCDEKITSPGPTIGKLETFGRQIALELGSQVYGLHIVSTKVQLASDIAPGQRAAEEDVPQAGYRTIAITIVYGLSR